MKAKQIVPLIKQLMEEGELKINVNIRHEHAKAGWGEWYVTETWAMIGGEEIKIGEGECDIPVEK